MQLTKGSGGGRGRKATAAAGLAAGLLFYLGALHGADSDLYLQPLMEAEFALQAGRNEEAAVAYARASELSSDPRVAERASRLALLIDDAELAEKSLKRWRALAPAAEGLARIELGLALRRGEMKPAESALQRLLQLEQGWKDVLQALAANQDSLLSPALLPQMIEAESVLASPDALLAVGGLADRLALAGTVKRVAELAVSRFPQEARAWLWHSEAMRKAGDEAAARRSIEQALALPGLPSDMRLAAAGLLAGLGDAEAAAQALSGGAQTDDTFAARAAFLSRLDGNAGLTALYQEMKQRSESEDLSPARRMLLGQLAEVLELDAEARRWFEGVQDPDQRPRAELRLAVLANKRGDLDEALKILTDLQQTELDDGAVAISAYQLEAELATAAGRYELALDAYRRGLAVFEDEPSLLYARALHFESVDRVDDAVRDLRRVVELDPDNPNGLNALGYTLADRTDQLEEARALIERALNMQPDNPAIIDSMGWVLVRLGKPEQGLPHLRRAFELQRDAEVAAHLGEALWLLGEHDEARSVWRLGHEIDADNRGLQRVLQARGEPL
ncbi:tetratricopeptide repeat protein [Pseudomarimonas arenosa]|uniref:Tetratricopeptide repeat protein n=1 Tax=Pseudomarimonas arenosa TaxID=2774145 RepID=A0AAW3ZHG8_9GAMM|nr:tetratricopeptide repeat protein [Pseudomarimonas arenosa]MBD8525528.1 tetratricopeptide repeat protein [Pseudomarimonas arenosa]